MLTAPSSSRSPSTRASKLVEIDVLRREHLDDQALGAVEKRCRRGGGGEQAHVLGQLGDERQREIAPDLVDARRHQADDRCGTARARAADKAPRRAREVHVEPALAQRGAACRQTFPQPARPTTSTNASDARRRRKSPWLGSFP